MDFIKIPYLPQKKVAIAVADLQGAVVPFTNTKVHPSLKSHGDLTFCYLGDGVAVCEKKSYDYYKEKLSHLGLKLIQGEKSLDLHYPHDAAYNVAIVGKRMFCKTAITDRRLLLTAEEMEYKIIDIRQGYSKCSVCPIDEQSAISADVSFAKKAEKEGIEVLLITNETILLKGFSNGFFGGSAFMSDKHTLSVNGNLKLHPDFERITEFLEKRNIAIKNLSPEPLYDFGSFIPLMEE